VPDTIINSSKMCKSWILKFCETGIVTPMVYVTKQRLTAVKTVHLGLVRSERQNQDLRFLLCNFKTHIE